MTEEQIEALLRDIRNSRNDLFEIVSKLRQIAVSSGSSITEEVKYGGILFSSKIGFCGVFCYAQHVSLEFGQGAQLPDPHNVLTGSGKHRRHIKIGTLADINGKHVAQYVAKARQIADAS
jgi:hypothetical protein